MSYEKMMKRFLEMDNNVSIPFSVRIYMLFFRKFNREVRELQAMFVQLRDQGAYEMSRDITDDLMQKIQRLNLLYGHSVSSMKWLFVGVVIWLSIMLITFSNSFEALKNHFGANLLVPLNIVLGAVVSIYAVCYILTHIDELKQILNYPFGSK